MQLNYICTMYSFNLILARYSLAQQMRSYYLSSAEFVNGGKLSKKQFSHAAEQAYELSSECCWEGELGMGGKAGQAVRTTQTLLNLKIKFQH